MTYSRIAGTGGYLPEVREQQLGEIRTVLAGDTGDEGALHGKTTRWLHVGSILFIQRKGRKTTIESATWIA